MTISSRKKRRVRHAAGRQRNLIEMQNHADEASALLKAMASPHRLLVLCNLAAGECSVGELLERIPLSQSSLSQHLAVLRAEELVNTRREAQTIYYSLAPGPSLEVMKALHGSFCARAGKRRARRYRSQGRAAA